MRKLVFIVCTLAVLFFFVSPVSAVSENDAIIGTWEGSESYWFIASGHGLVTFNSDNLASASGSVTFFGETIPFSADDLVWVNNGNNQYSGKSHDKQIDFVLNNDGTITAKVNPVKLGVTDIFLLNADIPVKLHKV